ncbi:MAG: leucine-rich repeat protein [Bacteroidales bacterium]|nr:leucine-rich repeat protein [Bacteroidales bacterium]
MKRVLLLALYCGIINAIVAQNIQTITALQAMDTLMAKYTIVKKDWFNYEDTIVSQSDIKKIVLEKMPDFYSKSFIYKDNCLLSADGEILYASDNMIPSNDFSSIKVPKGVKSIDMLINDFGHYLYHYKLYLPQSIQMIRGLPHGLYTFIIPKDNQYLKTENNNLLSKDGKILYLFGYVNETRLLVNVIIPEGVEQIDKNAFNQPNYYSGVDTLVLPKSLKSIDHLFGRTIIDQSNALITKNNCILSTDGKVLLRYGNTGRNVIVPDGVEYIDKNANDFYNYTDTLFLPKSLKDIDVVFGNTVIVQPGSILLKNNCIVSGDGKTLLRYGLTNNDIIIPEGVENVDQQAYSNKNLKCNNLFIPKSLKNIGEKSNTFLGFELFTDYLYPTFHKVIVADGNNYYQTKNNNTILINTQKQISHLGDMPEFESVEISSPNIPTKIDKITKGIYNIKIKGVLADNETIHLNKNIQIVKLDLKELSYRNGSILFDSKLYVDTLILPINYVFDKDFPVSAKHYIIPEQNQLYKIEADCLLSKDGKTLLNFLGQSDSIPPSVVDYDINLLKFVQDEEKYNEWENDELKYIYPYIFYRYDDYGEYSSPIPFPLSETAFTDRMLPHDYAEIGDGCESGIFYCCMEKPVYFKIHKNVEEISERALYHISEIDKDNPYYTMENGIIYNKEKTAILYGGQAKGHIIIPDGITALPSKIFLDRMIPFQYGAHTYSDSLSIEIPASVKEISNENFYYITSISPNNQHFILKDSLILSKDGKTLYYYGKKSKDIVIPEGVETFDRNALRFRFKEWNGGNKLLGYTIKEEEISAMEAFYDISSITLPKSVKSIGKNFFTKYTTIGNVFKFVVDPENKYYKTVGDRILMSKDGKEVIYYCKSGEIIIPDGVESLRINTFKNERWMGDGYYSAGIDWGFYDYAITIPASVSNIDKYFFYNDNYDGLNKVEIKLSPKNRYFTLTKKGVLKTKNGKIIYDPNNIY